MKREPAAVLDRTTIDGVHMVSKTSPMSQLPLISINNSPPAIPNDLSLHAATATQLSPDRTRPNTAPSYTPPDERPELVSASSAPEATSVAPASVPTPPTIGAHERRGSLGGSLSPRLGAKKGRMRPDAGYEMSPIGKAGGMVFAATASTKDDVAMAKWRQWAVDQPLAPTSDSPRSRKASGVTIPMSPPSPGGHSSSHTSYTSPIVLGSPLARPTVAQRISSSDISSSSRSVPPASPSRSGSGGRTFDTDIFMTDSVRALQDVELAIDEDVYARTAQTRQSSRLMELHARVSEAENPFTEIAGRLSSRRIRPIVLELIQALGHYIHTLWCLAHPTAPCPWVIPHSESSIATPLMRGWRSRTITAVHEARAEGLVPPPSPEQLVFWRAEVEYGLRDVDEVVGRWKKQGRVFHEATKRGYYGEVEDDNVLGSMGRDGPGQIGGDIARLLNDLEETLWGDALPRATDLSYLLPSDFDPFAPPGPDELFSPVPSSSLADALGSTVQGRDTAGSKANLPSSSHLDAVYALPDLMPPDTPLGDPSRPRSAVTNMGVTQVWTERARQSISAQGAPAHVPDSAALSLGEVGRKRHEEWLAGQRA